MQCIMKHQSQLKNSKSSTNFMIISAGQPVRLRPAKYRPAASMALRVPVQAPILPRSIEFSSSLSARQRIAIRPYLTTAALEIALGDRSAATTAANKTKQNKTTMGAMHECHLTEAVDYLTQQKAFSAQPAQQGIAHRTPRLRSIVRLILLYDCTTWETLGDTADAAIPARKSSTHARLVLIPVQVIFIFARLVKAFWSRLTKARRPYSRTSALVSACED